MNGRVELNNFELIKSFKLNQAVPLCAIRVEHLLRMARSAFRSKVHALLAVIEKLDMSFNFMIQIEYPAVAVEEVPLFCLQFRNNKFEWILDTAYIVMKFSCVLLLALLSVSLFQEPKIPGPPVDKAPRPFSGTYAASWIGGFCYNSTKCSEEYLSMWDRESFTIHGLWPSATVDPDDYSNFSVSNINSNGELLADMLNYWPAADNSSKPYYWLWQHEYNKHGKDYVKIVQYYYPEFENICAQEQQQIYFTAGINFYKNQKIQKIDLESASPPVEIDSEGSVVLTKAQLGQIISIDTDAFLVNCMSDVILQQIEICFRIQKNLDKSYENCHAIKANNETNYNMTDSCSPTFKLIGYKDPDAPSQQEVMKYPEDPEDSGSEDSDSEDPQDCAEDL